MRPHTHSGAALLAATLAALVIGGCDSGPLVPRADRITVATRTVGASLDADGYIVRIDGVESDTVSIFGEHVLSRSFAPGEYRLDLIGVAPNCVVIGEDSRLVEVGAAVEIAAVFDVECRWVPRALLFSTDRDGNRELYAMGPDGAYEVRLTRDDTHDHGPAWSPDGERIAYLRGSVLSIMGTDGSVPTSLRNEAWDVAWSPDGATIAATLCCVENEDDPWAWPDPEIWLMTPRGADDVPLTLGAYPAWSPDGARIALNLGNDIITMDTDGADPRTLTDGSLWSYDPDWSPDGSRIAFVRVRGRNADIYVMDADGSGLVRLTHNPALDHQPVW
nr:hypothetical protein [Gemmatimonadota bacterium]NIQ59224.1 hypothetical protein [Gemmatimonadota bacterium]NIU79407.1 hypothetical protein [Gammaproteobacteria bacterium]NIX48063.1 hypothetical protein [Gemmatimonadota bacterium]NIY12442.1 hypothetical protein [Gemmatimonadota bacterium]